MLTNEERVSPMSIKADEINILTLLESPSQVFRIPIYQRSYAWGKEQWKELWDDLQSLEGEDIHFLGSIVVISGRHNIGDFNNLEVVDGQQRLTTILLSLIAYRDIVKETDEDEHKYINDTYLYSKIKKNKVPKLSLGTMDREVYENLLNEIPLTQEQKKTQIAMGYFYFKEMLTREMQKKALEYDNQLLSKLNLVLISTGSHESAFRLFETLNNRGLDLSSVDLIKNYLLGKVSNDQTTLETCIEIWDKIVKNLDGIDKVKFFRQYILSKKTGVVSKAKLYEEYKKTIDNQKIQNAFLEDIFEKSEIYRNLCAGGFNKKSIDRRLQGLRRIEASTSYTLLLKAFCSELPSNDIERIIFALEIFTLRRSVCQTSTRDLDRIYNTLSSEAFQTNTPTRYIIDYLQQRTPTDEEFVTSLKNKDLNRNDQTKYILETIEGNITNSTNEKSINGRDDVHIEHIMPVEISSKKAKLRAGDWLTYLGDDAKGHRQFVNRLGNLTLLGSDLNIVASNNPFEEKKKEYEKSSILLTKEICQFSKWGINEIEVRSGILAERAVRIWDYNKIN